MEQDRDSTRPPARPRRERRPAGKAPSREALHEAALAHLARFAATEAGLLRVLDRRIDRWARAAVAEGAEADAAAAQAGAARQEARGVVARLAEAGAVDDRAFAESRARRLTRSGRSRRAAAAHLLARGVTPEVAGAVLPEDEETELAAALAYARRRRLGPFRTAPPGPDTRLREMAALARAGFAQGIAARALAMDAEAAEALVIRLRHA